MQRQYDGVADIRVLLDRIMRHFNQKGYDCEDLTKGTIKIEMTSMARKISGLSVGLRVAVSVNVKRQKTSVDITRHVEEYLLKAAVGLPLLVMAGPVAAVPAWGMYQQYKLGKELEAELDNFFSDRKVE